jgi:hypothetical protein
MNPSLDKVSTALCSVDRIQRGAAAVKDTPNMLEASERMSKSMSEAEVHARNCFIGISRFDAKSSAYVDALLNYWPRLRRAPVTRDGFVSIVGTLDFSMAPAGLPLIEDSYSSAWKCQR